MYVEFLAIALLFAIVCESWDKLGTVTRWTSEKKIYSER